MNNKRILILAGLLLPFLSITIALADIRLPAIFSDHMVVQQGAPVPVWGWADAGEKVSVTLGDRTGKATADKDGKWMVRLAALTAGGPLTLKVQGKNTIERTDVMVGEVWLCSGQSNMAFPVCGCLNRDAEIKTADFPQLRMFKVEQKTAEEPQTQANGNWKLTTPKTIYGFSGAAYFFGRRLHQELGVPVGLINASWEGTPIEAWTSWKTQEAVPELASILDNFKKQVETWDPEKAKVLYEKQMTNWVAASGKAKSEGKRFTMSKPRTPVDPRTDHHYPCRCYNGLIAPLVPYAIRGAIWYQGESNAGHAPLYALQLKTMIGEWRKEWGQGDFPFLFVQLPNLKKAQEKPVEDNWPFWPAIREVFRNTLSSVTNTGMAVTIDIGEAENLHPLNKQDVGIRLAQWALAKTYGKPIVACGPLYKGMHREGDKIVIEFDYVGGGLVIKNGDKLKGFAIAGADGSFVWADAKIQDNTVVLSSPVVKDPVAVRYAWANNPICNLYNKEGLPASPFRTDAETPAKPSEKSVK